VLVLRFCSTEIRRRCCDLGHMCRLWGPERARKVSRRLQQLETMATIDDLSFLPVDCDELDDGSIVVGVDDDLVLVIQPEPNDREAEAMQTINVIGVRAQSTVQRSP